MTSGQRTGFEAVLAAACLALAAAALAGGIDAKELMALLAGVETATARFVETRHSALLRKPLVSSGTLSYQRPNRIVRHTEMPQEERIVLDKGRLTIENRTLGSATAASLSKTPGVSALVESIRATRAGDLAALERYYEVRVSGARAKWRIDLVPRAPGLAQYVDSVAVSGNGARIARIEVREASGDRTVTEIDEELR
jgi:outer membrane lipoprotein-sorting protein